MAKYSLEEWKKRAWLLESSSLQRNEETVEAIDELRRADYNGSGIIIEIKNLEGKVLVKPTLINNGLPNDIGDRIIKLIENTKKDIVKFRKSKVPKERR